MSIQDTSHPAIIAPALLDWIAAGRRDLPWRHTRAPYAVWISEIMLQQTQVASVTPYFERWMIRFPSVHELAEAPLDDVLKAWEGLGYYARARNLHAAAQEIVAQHGGEIPADREALLRLPGIGRYTVGAILSLAFGQAEPILDGNVRRVLCRVDDIADDPKAPTTERRLWERAEALVQAVPVGRAGDLNEALMELGALVCTPGQPDCEACPLAKSCLAHKHGVETARPVKTARKQTPHYDVTAALVQDPGGCFLIVRRPAEGLLGGLWGFPGSAAGDCNAQVTGSGALAICLAGALRETLGIQVEVGEALPAIRHAYTHFRITLHPFRCRVVSGEPQALGYPAARWVSAAEMTNYAFPVTDRKIAGMLRNDSGSFNSLSLSP
jgi:A/G-specific adenine glycosylase